MTHLRLFKFLSVFLLSATVAFGQIILPTFGLNPAGNGARAAGMGFAFTGIADDATSIAWNPAGLAQLYSMEAGIVGRFGSGTVTFEGSGDEFSYERGASFDLNFASFVFPFEAGDFHMAAGVAYRTLYDFNEENDFSEIFGETYKVNFSGGIRAISPSVGFMLNEQFLFGATFNIITGSVDYEEDIEFSGQYSETIDYSGTAIDLGFLWKTSPMFSVGGAVTFGHTITAKTSGEEGETEVEAPLSFKVGAAVRPSDNLTLAFDYHGAPWSSSKLNGEDWTTTGGNAPQDINSIHVGLEYIAGTMPLRLGFYTKPTVWSNSDDSQESYSAATAGLGFILGTVILDGSFEYLFGSNPAGEGVDMSMSEWRVSLGAVVHLGQ